MVNHKNTIRFASLLLTVAVVGSISLAQLITTPISLAQNGPDYGAPKPPAGPSDSNGQGGYSPGGTNQELICRGDRDYTTFLSSVLSYDGFTEYWKDILVRYSANYCQYLDIIKLLEKITKVRAQIRKAFYVCADTRKLTDTYHKLEAELFFTRKFIDTDNSQFLETSDTKMLNDMIDFFVTDKGWFDKDQMKQIFTDLKENYSSRLENYKKCDMDDNWSKLSDKWKEFKENVVTIFTDPANNPVIKEAAADISKHYEKMANTSMNLGRSFFGGFLDLKINELSPKEGWDQIADEFEKNSPDGFTFEQFKAAQDTNDDRYEESLLAPQYLSKYQALFAETSDEYVKTFVQRLDILSGIIQGTYQYENQTIKCVKAVNHNEC